MFNDIKIDFQASSKLIDNNIRKINKNDTNNFYLNGIFDLLFKKPNIKLMYYIYVKLEKNTIYYFIVFKIFFKYQKVIIEKREKVYVF